MAELTIDLQVSPAVLNRALTRLGAVGVTRAGARALKRVAFDVVEAEKRHVAAIFDYAGPGTRNFMSGRGSFFFHPKPVPEVLWTRIQAAPKNQDLLQDHFRGNRFVVDDGGRLGLGRHLAVPIGGTTPRIPGAIPAPVLRGAGGKVKDPKRWTPSALYKQERAVILPKNARGRRQVLFAIRGRRGRTSKRSRASPGKGKTQLVGPAYVLIREAKVPRTYRFFAIANAVARTRFPQKMRQEFAKALRAQNVT